MRAIIVDDEPIMIRSFKRISVGLENLTLVSEFQNPIDALQYARDSQFDIVFLDISMPEMSGIELAKRLREINPDLIVVFITAYDQYIRDANRIGADYYIVKPYKRDVLEMMMKRMSILASRLQKSVTIRTFGRFVIFNNGKPVALRGKAKEILAYLVSRRGKEVSNEELYSALWEDREYSNSEMKVYYNAVKRLKDSLEEAGLSDFLISTSRGKMVDTSLFECDFYDWQDGKADKVNNRFEGEFMSEYSWAEEILGGMVSEMEERK